jgi:hypothetical protein
VAGPAIGLVAGFVADPAVRARIRIVAATAISARSAAIAIAFPARGLEAVWVVFSADMFCSCRSGLDECLVVWI